MPNANTAAARDYWNVQVSRWKITRQPEGTRDYFREIEDYRFEKLHYLPKVVNFAGFAGRRLLDVGCGLATDTSRFASGGAQVTGIDFAPRAIELARENFAQRGLSGDFQVMDGEAMTFPDASFDAVYCHTVLHFAPDPAAMVREIHRVLRPGGTAILMAVNCRSWMSFMRHVMKVEIDHLDAPVYHQIDFAAFERLVAPFAPVEVVPERFPVATKVHGGLKARLFNAGFVGTFNLLPAFMTRRTGHHLLAFGKR